MRPNLRFYVCSFLTALTWSLAETAGSAAHWCARQLQRRNSLLFRHLIAMIVIAFTSAGAAHATPISYDFSFGGAGVSGTGILSTDPAPDPLAPFPDGYDIVGLTGSVNGAPIDLLGQAGAPALSFDGFFIYDNIFYPAGQVSETGAFLDIDGLLLDTESNDYNLYYDGGSYVDYVDGGSGTPVSFTASEQPVPEPASILLFAAALLGLVAVRHMYRRSPHASSAAVKRAFDISASVLLLVLTLPVLLLAIVAVAIDSRGPVFYWQERVGRGGVVFWMCKLRTMRVDAESAGLPQWAAVADPRVTRVGRILRRLRVDELPQILNVLRGEMSFVGPRPERPQFVQSLAGEIPFYADRHCVKPGITGWAQVNYPYGASVDDARMKLAFDLHYVKHGGVVFDLWIVLATPKAVLAGGAR